MAGNLYGGRYRLGKMIYDGDSAAVFIGVDVTTNERVAIKRVKLSDVSLGTESLVYEDFYPAAGFPLLKSHGRSGDYRYMVMNLMGPNLEDLFNYCNRQFTLRNVLLIALQLVRRVEVMHSRAILHRNITARNIIIGLENRKYTLHLIDFGAAQLFLDARTGHHIPCLPNQSASTSIFSSINSHFGNQLSRRDDLESLGHLFIYLLRGSLPWQGRRPEEMKLSKMSTSISSLCEGIPAEFASYLEYCRELKFDAKPDYCMLRKRFHDLYIGNGYSVDSTFDWKDLVFAPQEIKHVIKPETKRDADQISVEKDLKKAPSAGLYNAKNGKTIDKWCDVVGLPELSPLLEKQKIFSPVQLLNYSEKKLELLVEIVLESGFKKIGCFYGALAKLRGCSPYLRDFL